MERFEVFRSNDPRVSSWLQKNGFQKRSSVSHTETGKMTTTSNQEKMKQADQTKEVKLFTDKYMQHSKIPSLAYKQAPKLKRNKTESKSNGRFSNSTEYMPAIGSSLQKRVIYQERTEPTQPGNTYTSERRIRSYSSPPNNEPSLSRRYSTLSLFSDRPSNIPVLLRNNNIRLRKYSCPEYYSTSANHFNEQKRGRELETKGFAKRTATNVSNNTSQQLAKELRNQTTREMKLREQNDSKDNTESKRKPAERRGNGALLQKGLNDFRQVPATDFNANEICSNPKGQVAGSSSDESDKGLGVQFYEEDSLQSYSLEVQRPKQNLPSSMYSARSTMLTWLGDVNRNNPQLWS